MFSTSRIFFARGVPTEKLHSQGSHIRRDQVIGNLQIEDPKREEIPKENWHRQEERDAPTLKRSMTRSQMEGAGRPP